MLQTWKDLWDNCRMTPPKRNFFPPSSVSTLCTPTEKRYVAQNAAQCAHFLKRPYQWDNTIDHLWKCDKCCNFTFRQRRHGNEKKISWNQIVQSGTDLKFLSMLYYLLLNLIGKQSDALLIDKKCLGQSHSTFWFLWNKWTCNVIMRFFF